MKSKKTLKQHALSVLIISFGLFINGAGLACLYSVSLGSSPMGTFSDGLHNLLHISQGYANILANAAFLIVLLIGARAYISMGTLLCTFTLGLYVNLAMEMLHPLNLGALPFPGKLGVSIMGTLLMGAGLGIYVSVNWGLGPLEAMVDIIYRHTHFRYMLAKTGFDALLGALGILFGAGVGVGTVISILCTGLVMDAVIRRIKPVFANMPQDLFPCTKTKEN